MSRFSRSVLSLLLSGMAIQASAADTLIRQARVFDGERIIGVRDVLIQDGKITRVAASIAAPADAVITEAAGKTLMPGMIDSHVHAFKDQELPLLFGVTAQIDLFAAQAALQAFNRQLKEKNTRLPDTYSAGMLATVKGGHGTEYGLPVETLSAPDQAQAWVDARIAEGSHFIKIVMESGGHEHVVPSLSRDTVKALISAAHKRNKLALVHISSIDDALFALENGADGLVHLFTAKEISDQQISAMVRAAKKHHAFVIPTFSVLNSIAGIKADAVLANPVWMRWLTPVQQQALQQTYGRKPQPELVAPARKAAAAFQRAGIPVLAGTDAGNNGTQFGISMHQELLELVEAGLTPGQALQAATSS
ncbi:amidohydrolase family protein, partial [Undibacterium luofuense]|uniref:amidohydrolase family protein n=1 Tax=Undibacterium luofuense TaxID=2828733 RepID=UPI0030EB41A8